MEQNKTKKVIISISVVGSSMCGKTTLINRYYGKPFDSVCLATMGTNFVLQNIEIIDGNQSETLKMKIWDNSGKSRMNNIIQAHLQKTQGIMLVTDVTQNNYLDNFEDWINIIKEVVDIEKFPIILVSNKIELLENRIISTEECKKIANTYNFPYYETSAKMGIGIDQAFNELISMVYSNLNKKTKIEYTIYKEPSVDIEEHYYAKSTKELKVLIIKIDSEKYENNLYSSLDELIFFLQNMKPTQCDINYSKYLTLLFRKIKTISNQSKQNYYYVNTYLQVLVVFPELESFMLNSFNQDNIILDYIFSFLH